MTLDEIKGDVMLERDPMVNLCQKNEMNCFIHDGFWKCFDTAKDVKSFKEIDCMFVFNLLKIIMISPTLS